jgi:hypothetical protein
MELSVRLSVHLKAAPHPCMGGLFFHTYATCGTDNGNGEAWSFGRSLGDLAGKQDLDHHQRPANCLACIESAIAASPWCKEGIDSQSFGDMQPSS